jgi:uncharacterized membrane protein YheB (UPF0754 family)
MKTLLIWIIPPLAGAIIGYLTNAVAIKMLFRPLHAVRIFGIILPFTPGVLPRQRHKLADNIGAIVENQLLTADIIIARLRREDVQRGLKNTIAGCTDKLLAVPLDAEKLSFLNRTLREILGTESASLLEKHLAEILARRFRNSAPQISAHLAEVAERAFPRWVETFILFLEKPEMHGLLEIQGRIFLNNAILKLSVFQRFFLSAGQYDKTLHDRMPEIIDDLIRQLRDLLEDREVRDGIIGFLSNTVRTHLLGQDSSEHIASLIAKITASFTERPLGEILQFLLSGGKHTLGEILSINQDKKEWVDSLLQEKFLALAERQGALLLRTLNIKTLVSERIDSLDMLAVEHIVLDVMVNQLKWINIFGAILGAIIGLFQSALAWFMR